MNMWQVASGKHGCTIMTKNVYFLNINKHEHEFIISVSWEDDVNAQDFTNCNEMKVVVFFLFCWTQHNNTTSRTHADILFWCCLVYCAAWTRRLIRLSWTAGPARLRLSWTLIVFNLSNNLSWITLNKDQLHQSARSSYWFIFLSQLKLTVTLIAFTRTLMCFCECVFLCLLVCQQEKLQNQEWVLVSDPGWRDGWFSHSLTLQ